MSNSEVASKCVWLLVMTTSLLLLGCGTSSYRHDKCQAQPLLPQWMIMAGVLLFIIGATTAVLSVWRNKLAKQRKTLFSIGWAFCWGLILLVGYLIWFAMWIAGTYFAIDTIQSIKVSHQLSLGANARNCDHATIGPAGVSIFIIWIVSFHFCATFVKTLVKSRNKSARGNEELYEAVPN